LGAERKEDQRLVLAQCDLISRSVCCMESYGEARTARTDDLTSAERVPVYHRRGYGVDYGRPSTMMHGLGGSRVRLVPAGQGSRGW
jgi:hypothetical protein